jgi:hypothetical protein
MKRVIVTITQGGTSKEFDVIARSTITAILCVIDSVKPAKPFSISGKVIV